MTESILFPKVEVWSPRFWELFWRMEINKTLMARAFEYTYKESLK